MLNSPQKQIKFIEPDLNPEKTIRLAVSGDVQITKLEREIIDTKDFQRLRRIKQLGTSYLVYPSAVHTRFEHSLGTLNMAEIMVQKIRRSRKIIFNKKGITLPDINESGRQMIRLVALLHDVTQVPFGHTIEKETHLLNKDHDSDLHRFNFYFPELKKNKGEKKISEILISRIGLQQFKLFKKIFLVNKKNVETELGEYTYIHDIVKNTVCADLLDYIKRDAYYCNLNIGYGDRFLNFLYLTREEIDNKEVKRVAVRTWKEKEQIHRRDIINELISLLRCRFALNSSVYFHHAKIISSAMISRAVQRALEDKILTNETLWEIGDDELLYLLKNKGAKDVKYLSNAFLNRDLYSVIFSKTRIEIDANDETNLIKYLDNFFNKDPGYRKDIEDKLSETYNCGKKGDVIIYCPDEDMSMKEAKMRVLWKNEVIALDEIEDNLAKSQIRNIMNSHRNLWTLKVLISSNIKEKIESKEIDENDLCEFSSYYFYRGNEQKRHLKNVIKQAYMSSKENDESETTEVLRKVYDELVDETENPEEFRKNFNNEKNYSVGKRDILELINKYSRKK